MKNKKQIIKKFLIMYLLANINNAKCSIMPIGQLNLFFQKMISLAIRSNLRSDYPNRTYTYKCKEKKFKLRRKQKYPVTTSEVHEAHRKNEPILSEMIVIEDKPQPANFENLETIYLFGNTLIHLACLKGNLKMLKDLAKKTIVKKFKERNYQGDSPLDLACNHGHINLVRWLIEKIGNNVVNESDNKEKQHFGWSPLHHACYKNRQKIVKLLVETYGADINIQTRRTSRPIDLACENQHKEIAEYLTGKENYPLHNACTKGNLTTVKYLCEILNYPIKTKNNDELTALDLACTNQHKEIAEYLGKKEDK